MDINDGRDWTRKALTTTIPMWLYVECKKRNYAFNELLMRGYQHANKMPKLLDRVAKLEEGNTRLQGYITAMNENHADDIAKLEKLIKHLEKQNPKKKPKK